jgi:hypothetical protein
MPSRIPLQVLSGNSPMDELPDELDLSELADDMERLWAKSIARLGEGIVVEHAATIVMQADGSLKLINEVAGDSLNVLPNFAIAAPDIFVGTFHTHPRTDGLLPMPFSYTDFASAIQLDEKLSVLYSDEIVFALVRTTFTTEYVDLNEIATEFYSFLAEVDPQTEFLPNAVWAANKWFAEKYGFGLYMGNTDMLRREV